MTSTGSDSNRHSLPYQESAFPLKLPVHILERGPCGRSHTGELGSPVTVECRPVPSPTAPISHIYSVFSANGVVQYRRRVQLPLAPFRKAAHRLVRAHGLNRVKGTVVRAVGFDSPVFRLAHSVGLEPTWYGFGDRPDHLLPHECSITLVGLEPTRP